MQLTGSPLAHRRCDYNGRFAEFPPLQVRARHESQATRTVELKPLRVVLPPGHTNLLVNLIRPLPSSLIGDAERFSGFHCEQRVQGPRATFSVPNVPGDHRGSPLCAQRPMQITYLYNDTDDIDAAAAGIRAAQEFFGVA